MVRTSLLGGFHAMFHKIQKVWPENIYEHIWKNTYEHIRSEDMLADMLTKTVKDSVVQKFLPSLGLFNFSDQNNK